MLSLLFKEYYYLRQTLPIFLYVFYIHFKDKDNRVIDACIKTGIISIGIGTLYFMIGMIIGIPFMNMIPFKWHYQGPITWGIFFLTYFFILTQKGNNSLIAFTLSTLAVVGGGWLYEASFWYTQSMWVTHAAIFYINGQIVCLLLLGYEFRKMGFKPNKFIGATLILLIFFSGILVIDFKWLWRQYGSLFMRWFYRFPACLFLLSLLSGIKKREGNEKNV